MVMSVIRFLTTVLLTVVGIYSLSSVQGDLPLIALLIPALWLYPQSGVYGILLIVAMSAYGLALPLQELALSISTWILFPILMVAFDSKSTKVVKILLGICVMAMYTGIILAQVDGKVTGSAGATVVQLLSVTLIWYVAMNWRSSPAHSWGALLFIIPMWIAGLQFAAMVALSVTGIISVSESLKKIGELDWSKLIYWALPTVGFAALILNPEVEIPDQVLVAWIFMLGAAWATDYFLSMETLE
ncbi:hypothetical protein P7F88_21925 [Vibrio hannami]|uniref:hypothetical protein n=1 Tax=Vibrio hannami TaxID=2717094 RepID=UPI00240FF22D|nr:hypothetical protein [Vibrio hannami]MDG3088579.1 hypothetical protein [Vibrio hannami]